MKNIVIMALEPLESRYTAQWHVGIKEQLEQRAQGSHRVIQIDGDTNSGKPTEGAFLDFLSTNLWKNEQTNKLLAMVRDGTVGKGDAILFTDAWNPTILEVKYVNDLMGMGWTLHGIWHAGQYDPQDFLGRLIQNKAWPRATEQAIFHALDHNYYATDFHINLFHLGVLGPSQGWRPGKVVKSGQPHEKLLEVLNPYVGTEQKENLILFPHRVAPEKQPEIFRDLAKSMPQYDFMICQEQNLSKHEYHTLMARAKIMFSANLQETLGISALEAIKLNTTPLLPNRLSYSEMYENEFLYDPNWTLNWDAYLEYKEQLINSITWHIENFESLEAVRVKQLARLERDYLSGDIMYDKLLKG